MQEPHLILGSKSPRRKQLLGYITTDFDVHSADVDESIQSNESPIHYVERVCLLKLNTIRSIPEFKDAQIICADTSVHINSKILGKPADKFELKSFLELLSNNTHTVTTAYCVSTPETTITRSVHTSVIFRELHESMINDYLDMEEAYDKAGGYGIQGYASRFIQEVRGSVSNVIGLPLVELENDLRTLSLL